MRQRDLLRRIEEKGSAGKREATTKKTGYNKILGEYGIEPKLCVRFSVSRTTVDRNLISPQVLNLSHFGAKRVTLPSHSVGQGESTPGALGESSYPAYPSCAIENAARSKV